MPNVLVPRRFWPLVALYVATLALVFVLIVALPGRPGGAIIPPTTPAGGRSATPLARPYVPTVGAGVVSVRPALPFTLWQPAYNILFTHLSAYAYRPAAVHADTRTVRGEIAVGPDNTHGDGEKDDPAVTALANREANLLLGDDSGAAIVLVYVADGPRVGADAPWSTPVPTRLFAVAQRPAGGRALPPGEAAWFSGTPATFVREPGRVVLRWLAGDTFLTLTTNQSPEEAVVFAESLKPTALAPPDGDVLAPTPTPTFPTPRPAGAVVRPTTAPIAFPPSRACRRGFFQGAS